MYINGEIREQQVYLSKTGYERISGFLDTVVANRLESDEASDNERTIADKDTQLELARNLHAVYKGWHGPRARLYRMGLYGAAIGGLNLSGLTLVEQARQGGVLDVSELPAINEFMDQIRELRLISKTNEQHDMAIRRSIEVIGGIVDLQYDFENPPEPLHLGCQMIGAAVVKSEAERQNIMREVKKEFVR